MGKLVANENATFNVYEKVAHDLDALNGGGVSVTISTPASQKVTAGNAGVYAGDLAVIIPMGVKCLNQYTTTAPGVATVKASGSPTSNNQKLVLLGDKGTASAVPNVAPSGSPPPTGTVDLTVEIVDAGQTKVEAS